MNTPIFSDLMSTLVVLVAVFLVGLSKGGFGGAFGILGVPILALIMPPLEAVAFLLPIYLVMDAISLWTWRGQWEKKLVLIILPVGIVGIAIGWITASIVSEEMVGLLVGIIALLFILQRLIYRKFKNFKSSIKQNNWSGYFLSLIHI